MKNYHCITLLVILLMAISCQTNDSSEIDKSSIDSNQTYKLKDPDLELLQSVGNLKRTKTNGYSSYLSYDFYLKEDTLRPLLSFNGDEETMDSLGYTSLSLGFHYLNDSTRETMPLSEIMKYVPAFWNVASREHKISLNYCGIGDPDHYEDISKVHINAFQKSTKWREHIKKSRNNRYLCTTGPIEEVMLEYDVYQPIHNFLKTKGYHITNISGEKTSLDNFTPKAMGYENPVMVPHHAGTNLAIEKI